MPNKQNDLLQNFWNRAHALVVDWNREMENSGVKDVPMFVLDQEDASKGKLKLLTASVVKKVRDEDFERRKQLEEEARRAAEKAEAEKAQREADEMLARLAAIEESQAANLEQIEVEAQAVAEEQKKEKAQKRGSKVS